jgi:hypothetical protein
MSNTDTFTAQDGTQYVVRLRVGWRELQATEDAGYRIFVEGQAFEGADDLSDLEVLELRPNRAQQNFHRLKVRLVSVQRPGEERPLNLKTRDLDGIPVQHVDELIPYIAQLEKEEGKEIRDLQPGNPTEKRLSE